MFIPVVLGTARDGAQSAKVADFVLKKAQEYGFETELIKVGDYIEAKTARVKQEGNTKALPWKEIVAKAHGFIFIIPEYNHSFPGEFKIFLDTLYKEYAGLTAGLIGVSAGGLGGARAIEHIKPIMNNFQIVATQKAVYFSVVQDLFDESGNIKDESYNEKLTKLFDEVKWFAERLKSSNV